MTSGVFSNLSAAFFVTWAALAVTGPVWAQCDHMAEFRYQTNCQPCELGTASEVKIFYPCGKKIWVFDGSNDLQPCQQAVLQSFDGSSYYQETKSNDSNDYSPCVTRPKVARPE